MSERALRDELEHLQAEGQGLESELRVTHRPEFLARRDQLLRVLDESRQKLAELERSVLTVGDEHAAASTQVARLAAELQSFEQQRLVSGTPFALLPVAFVVIVALLYSGGSSGLAAFCSAASLGLLFGPRILDWARPGRQRAPIAPNLLQGIGGNEATVAMSLSLVTALLAVRVLLELASEHMRLPSWARWGPEDAHVFLTFPLEGLAVTSVALALWARRRARLSGQAGQRTALFAAVLGLITLGALAWTWIPEFGDATGSYYWQSDSLPLSAFAAIAPLSWALVLQRRPEARSFTALPASLAWTAASLFFTFKIVGPFRMTNMFDVGGLWGALACGAGALVLGWDFAHRERATLPRARWAGVAAAAISLAAAVFRCGDLHEATYLPRMLFTFFLSASNVK